MFAHPVAQKGDTPLQLIKPVDTVFDADPTVEFGTFQHRKDRVVVVHSLSDFAVAQPFRVARAVFFLTQLVDGAVSEISITVSMLSASTYSTAFHSRTG